MPTWTYKWDPEEDKILLRYAGKYPAYVAAEKFINAVLRHNKKNGTTLPVRTDKAIATRILRLKGTSKPTQKRWSLGDAATTLGIEYHAFREWAKRGHFKMEKYRGRFFVTKEELLFVAENRPKLLAGCLPVGIEELLGKDIAKKISEYSPVPRSVPVYSSEGVRYESIKEAARGTGKSTATIRRHLEKRTMVWRTEEDFRRDQSRLEGYTVITVYRLSYADFSIEEFKAKAINESFAWIEHNSQFQRTKRNCQNHYYGTKEEVLAKAEEMVKERLGQFKQLRRQFER
jgi:hypothetical protein